MPQTRTPKSSSRGWYVILAMPGILLGFILLAFHGRTNDIDSELHRVEWRVQQLGIGQVEIDESIREADGHASRCVTDLAELAEDIEVAHQRLDDIWEALGIMAKRTPGQARPPRIPKRERP